MTSDDLISAISEVVSELNDLDVNLYEAYCEHVTNQKKHLELLRDLIEEIKHLRYAVDRVGR